MKTQPAPPLIESPEAPECATIAARIANDAGKGLLTSIAAIGFIRRTCGCPSCAMLRQAAKVAHALLVFVVLTLAGFVVLTLAGCGRQVVEFPLDACEIPAQDAGIGG